MNPLLNIAIKAARNGSKIILRHVDRIYAIAIHEKSSHDFVTEVDKLVEQEIIHTIRTAHPHHAILAEESGQIAENSEFTWIIDPLDGTTNFIRGIPQYAISIAVKHKDKITQGVVYDPLKDELFTASQGEGAYLNNRRIRVRDCKKLSDALLSTGFPFKNPGIQELYLKSFHALSLKITDTRRAGSAALDLAYVAAGRHDGHWELALHEWDIAAGILLIKEAGGFVGDIQGNDNYLTTGNIVAASPKIFPEILKVIKPVFA